MSQKVDIMKITTSSNCFISKGEDGEAGTSRSPFLKIKTSHQGFKQRNCRGGEPCQQT